MLIPSVAIPEYKSYFSGHSTLNTMPFLDNLTAKFGFANGTRLSDYAVFQSLPNSSGNISDLIAATSGVAVGAAIANLFGKDKLNTQQQQEQNNKKDRQVNQSNHKEQFQVGK